jgi:hypothetical protein
LPRNLLPDPLLHKRVEERENMREGSFREPAVKRLVFPKSGIVFQRASGKLFFVNKLKNGVNHEIRHIREPGTAFGGTGLDFSRVSWFKNFLAACLKSRRRRKESQICSRARPESETPYVVSYGYKLFLNGLLGGDLG